MPDASVLRLPLWSGRGGEQKMAHIITDAEAQTLTRIAKSLIGPIVSQGVIQKRDMDDAVQELLQEAIRLSEEYDGGSSADFITFAHGVMKIQIFRVIRKLWSATTRILTDAIPIDALNEAEDTDEAVMRSGFVSVVPCRVDMTDYEAVKSLQSWNYDAETL